MRRILATLTFVGLAATLPHATAALLLPNRTDSLKIAVVGDNGTGKAPQMELAAQMAAVHQQFSYELVLMMGDNFYGSQGPPTSNRSSRALTGPCWTPASRSAPRSATTISWRPSAIRHST